MMVMDVEKDSGVVCEIVAKTTTEANIQKQQQQEEEEINNNLINNNINNNNNNNSKSSITINISIENNIEDLTINQQEKNLIENQQHSNINSSSSSSFSSSSSQQQPNNQQLNTTETNNNNNNLNVITSTSAELLTNNDTSSSLIKGSQDQAEEEIQDLIRHSTELMRKSIQLTQEYIDHIEQFSETTDQQQQPQQPQQDQQKQEQINIGTAVASEATVKVVDTTIEATPTAKVETTVKQPEIVENHPLSQNNKVTTTATATATTAAEATTKSPDSPPKRLFCKMHRSSYLMTQLGGLQSNTSNIQDLLNEKNPDTGMGYREPGPQGFLSYVNLDPNQPLPMNNSTSANNHNHSKQQLQHQSNGSLSGYMNSSNSANDLNNNVLLRGSSNNLNGSSGNINNSTGHSKIRSSHSQLNLSSSGGNVGTQSGGGNGVVPRSVSMLKSDESKRKSFRQNRMQKNEEDRRKRKEQKRARAREKPLYVGSMEELPPECIKMIKKSKIPEDKLRENFDILILILRFRTGFNLKSANPLSKSISLSSREQMTASSNNLAASITTTTTTTTTSAISPETNINNNSSNTFGGRNRSESRGISSKVETHGNGGGEDDSGYDDGSRLEQSIIPKGTVELFEKGDVKKLYKNLKQIGSGGFGSVYLAKSLVDKCEIAIKKIAHTTPKAQRTNLNEIGFLHFCNHPNVVRYLRSHLIDDQVWIAMEYMQGGTLTEACSNHSFNESCIAYVARGMLEGLKYLHSNNLVHRDIKSGNIMMTIEGKIKIVDFGLCVDSTERKLTHMAGSPFWMSPEMIRGDGYGCPSDLWSFGICLLELANGEPPNRKSSLNAMFAIATHQVNGHTGLDRPEKWSDYFKHFLTLCLEVDPAKRQTADQLLTHPWLTISENPETMKKILAQIFIANVMNHLDPI